MTKEQILRRMQRIQGEATAAVDAAAATKHTPGPWVAESNPGRNPVTWRVVKFMPAPGRPMRMCVADLPAAITAAEANARLVAAAPDLLAACKRALSDLVNMTTADFATGSDHGARDALADAIAKAEGR